MSRPRRVANRVLGSNSRSPRCCEKPCGIPRFGSRWTQPPRRRRCSSDTLGRRGSPSTSAIGWSPTPSPPNRRTLRSGCLGRDSNLINAFNAWKGSEAAGRVFVVARDGATTKKVTGLAWRHDVSAQVFEEAAVDLGHALAAYGRAKVGKGKGQRVGFPRRKRKGRCRDSFRLRNKQNRSGTSAIRIGELHPRSVTLPKLGTIRVHDDTRRLRRLLHPVDQIDPDTGQPKVAPLARILFITCSRHGSRWYISLNVCAPEFHPERRHQPRLDDDSSGFVGVDRGLAALP